MASSRMTALYDSAVASAARLVSPASLAHVAGDVARTPAQWEAHLANPWSDAAALGRAVRVLRPGDIILTRTPGAFYSAARASADSVYDHVVVVARNGMCIHVGPPIVRLLRIERILDPKRCPLVLRPRLNTKQRRRFVVLLERHLGKRYDTAAAYTTMARLGLERATGFAFGRRRERSTRGTVGGGGGGGGGHLIQDRIICTDTTLSAVCRVSKAFRNSVATCTPSLDCMRFRNGSASLEDFLRLHRHRPDLLVRIPLPLQLFSNAPPPRAAGILTLSGALTAMGRVSGSAGRALGQAGAMAVESALRQRAAAPVANAMSKLGLVTVVPTPEIPLVRDLVSNSSALTVAAAAPSARTFAVHLRVAVEALIRAMAKTVQQRGGDFLLEENRRDWRGRRGRRGRRSENTVHVNWNRMGAVFAMASSLLLWTRRRRILFAVVNLSLFLFASRIALRRAKGASLPYSKL
jgi:hypothetical protein